MNLTLPPSVSVSEASRLVAQVRTVLRRFPEVTQVISQAGRPRRHGSKPINMCEFFVDLKPPSEWTRKITREELSAQMEDAINGIPGLEPAISQPIRDNVLESISQIDGQIVIKVFGDDLATLRSTVNDVLRAVSHVRGVSRAFIDRAGEVPQLQIDVDRGRAARYGLNVADVEDVVETALGGKVGTRSGTATVAMAWRAVARARSEGRGGDRQRPGRHAGGSTSAAGRRRQHFRRGGSMNISRESGTGCRPSACSSEAATWAASSTRCAGT